MSGRNPRILTECAAIHARRGDLDSAEALYQELRSRARTGYIGWSEQGTGAAAAGHREDARALVARGIDARESYLVFWKSPAWGPFLADAEGLKLLRSIGIC